jgi:aspartyl-tRNA(Asn)/glutamyl-tRNA(Gln) amidotransferase subunit A
MSEPLWKLDACTIADLVRGGELAAKEVVETFLERIEAHNPGLNAFVYLDPGRARADAAELDRRISSGEDPGAMAGVPIGVKDLEDVAGMPTAYGSLLFQDNIATADSIQVARLRAAGCVIVGKTATPEFGAATFTSTPLHGVTRNPWNLSRTPGGSSGGSAAAVAAALVPIATGSDGGGSIRIPASYSSLVGPKGSFGRVPRGGSPESSYTSVRGPLSRSVRDAARYLDCVIGADERDQFSLPLPSLSYEKALSQVPSGLKAAWSTDLGFATCAQQVEWIAREAADVLAASRVFRWVDRRVELLDPSRAWLVLGAPESWNRLEPFWPERENDLTPIVRAGMVRALHEFDLKEIGKAIKARWENNQILAEIFEEVDLIVTPTTPTVAFAAEGPMPETIEGRPIEEMHALALTYPFNLSGHPAVSIPCGFDADGLPVGLQIVGHRHTDHVLLAIAAAFERLRPWPGIATDYAS